MEKGTLVLTDVAISGDRNVIKKEGEKILKYKNPTREIPRTWKVKTKVMPVRTEATEAISKSFREYPRNTPGKHEMKKPRKQPYWALHTYFGKC
jgi:hypothetical protein